MIRIDYACDRCVHIRENIDGWKMCCDAFPAGIPKGFFENQDVTVLDECANGIGFEPKDEQ